MKFQLKQHSILPGFGLTLGFTVFYLSLIVLIPLSALFLRSATMPVDEFISGMFSAEAISAYKLTFGASLIGAMVNMFFGFIVAWVLVRYRFPGRQFLDAIVDLPFALPTAVSGIALASIYAKNGWIGQFLYPLGIKSAYSQLGVTIALTFIGLPFVVRTLQPALEEMDGEAEEAAASLGASRLQTFLKVIVPTVMPAILTGFALAFARALGEYGSVIFISGNRPNDTQIASEIIFSKLEQYDYAGAAGVAVVMLMASFVILLFVNLLQWWSARGMTKGV